MRRTLVVLLIAVATAGTTVVGVASTPAATNGVPWWENCKHVNARFPHGVGRRFAHDKTSGIPVTNFRRSTLLYLRAIRHNRGLDRDKDGIACEKH
jgi:Excalibur calcium-binding domain